MHELGLMTGVLDAVTQSAVEAGATKVLKVTLSVGEMTEAIEDCLTFAYEALTEENTLFSGSELEIHMVKPRSRCLDCGLEFDLELFLVTCPQCGSPATQLIAGRDLRIDSIEFDIPDDADPAPAKGAPAAECS